MGVGKLSEYENKLIEKARKELNGNIEKGLEFAKQYLAKSKQTCFLFTCQETAQIKIQVISCFCFRLDFLFYKKKKSKMVRLNVDQMSRYVSPVNPSAFPTLAISLLGKTIEMNIKNSFLKLHSRYWRFFNGMVFCL